MTGRILPSPFRAAWWLPSPHPQSIWPNLLRLSPDPPLRREHLDLPDGDFVHVDWYGPETGPVTILLHGLGGCSRSRYLRGLQVVLARRGWRTATLNLRGAGMPPNRQPRFYHAGDTADLDYFHAALRRREPQTTVVVVGFSLGANILLNWLAGRDVGHGPLAAVAVSPPFSLHRCAEHLEHGLARAYRDFLLQHLREAVRRKRRYFEQHGLRVEARRLADLEPLDRLQSFWDFDHCVTAPLNGFGGADDYYAQSSCRSRLRAIAVPTLVLHALDDPLIPPDALPTEAELGPGICLELSRTGGHVGFVGGRFPLQPRFYLETRIADFLAPHLGR